MARLTELQKRFVAEYLVDLNATQAAKRAGYKDPNIGRQLITNHNVSEAIQKAIAKREQRTQITQDMVLRELAAIGFSKATDYVTIESGCAVINDTSGLTDAQRGAIASIERTKYGIKIRLHDKVRALEKLGEHLGLFDSRVGQNQNIENNIFDVINESTRKEIDTSAIPEIESPAESGDDLVE